MYFVKNLLKIPKKALLNFRNYRIILNVHILKEDYMLTMSYKDILIAVLLLLTIILVIYLIVLIKRMMPSVKKLQQITDEALEITKSAKESLTDVQKVVSEIKVTAKDANKSVRGVTRLLDSNKNTVSAVTHLANAAAAIINLFK